MSDSLVGTE